MKKRWMTQTILGMLAMCFIFCMCTLTVEAKKDVVIVIDPGHGGTNMGAKYNGVIEKEATLKVAIALKEELEKYEGVIVYLTRTGDETLGLDERADFASAVKADILLSLHFNMSELHDLHGSEMWISSQGVLKTKAQNFAKIEQMLLEDYGIETRGCFTRLNDAGQEYYGVIRESAQHGIPAVIVEHCYLDRAEEEQFYDTNAALDRLGRIDATAVAMTYGLSSEELGVDYSGHRAYNTELPESVIAQDVTPPETVKLSLESYNDKTNEARFRLMVSETESTMVYYQYSYNGGKTFSDPILLNTDKDVYFSATVYPSSDSGFMVRAYNAYDLYTDSEVFDLNYLLFGIHPKAVSADNEEAVVETMAQTVNIPDEENVSAEVLQMSAGILMIGIILGGGSICFLCLHNKGSMNRLTSRMRAGRT